MLGFLGRRLLRLLPLLVVISAVVFVIVHLVPGDPVDNMLQPGAGPETRAMLVAKYGLDRPLVVQYAVWVGRALQGDLGDAMIAKQPVGRLVAQALPYSLRLGLLAIALSTVLGIAIGALAASFPESRFDHAIMGASLIGSTIPVFWLGLILILIFAVELRWAPVSGARDWHGLILPAATIGLAGTALIARVTRAAMADVAGRDFLLLLHAKGLPRWRIQLRYVLRQALVPVVTILGLRIGLILGGTVTVEYIFARPGLGTLLIRGLSQRDYPVVQGTLLLLSLGVVVGTFLSDVALAYLDPRVRAAR